jgi:hypothetical protein
MAIKILDGLQNREEVVLHALHAVSSRAGVGPDGAASGAALPYDIWLREIESTGGSSESTWVTIDRSRPVALTWLRRHGEQSAFYEQVGNLEGEMGRAAERALTMEAATWAHLHGILWLYMRGDAVHLQPLDADRLRYTPLAPKVEMVKHLPREMLRHLSL